MQVHRHMEDAHGIFHNIDSILTMVFLEPFEKQVWPAILQSLPFFFFCFSFLCLASHILSAYFIARVISPLIDLILKGDLRDGDAKAEEGGGEGQGQDGGQERGGDDD